MYNRSFRKATVDWLLANLGALSDALVCRRRWDCPAVLHERDIVLGTNAKDFINSWRIKAVKEVLASFQIVKEAEKKAHGSKSYFNLLDTAGGGPFPFVEEDELNQNKVHQLWCKAPTTLYVPLDTKTIR